MGLTDAQKQEIEQHLERLAELMQDTPHLLMVYDRAGNYFHNFHTFAGDGEEELLHWGLLDFARRIRSGEHRQSRRTVELDEPGE